MLMRNLTAADKPTTVLVVDDSEDDVALTTRAFKKVRFNATLQVVRSGTEAVAYLEGTSPYSDRRAYPRPELLVLDLKMPGLDGFDVLKWFRTRPEYERTPVVILTSMEAGATVNRTYTLGATVYFVKPGGRRTFEEVAREIKNFWLAHRDTPAPPFAAGTPV